MVESAHGWLDAVSLSHLEVLSEVLISAPPVGVDHIGSLVPPDLMEITVSHVLLLPVYGHMFFLWESVFVVDHSIGVQPLLHIGLLRGSADEPDVERLVQLPNQQSPDDSHSVLVRQTGDLPEGVCPGIFDESSKVLECSPLLSHVSGLLCFVDELGEVAVGFLGE